MGIALSKPFIAQMMVKKSPSSQAQITACAQRDGEKEANEERMREERRREQHQDTVLTKVQEALLL